MVYIYICIYIYMIYIYIHKYDVYIYTISYLYTIYSLYIYIDTFLKRCSEESTWISLNNVPENQPVPCRHHRIARPDSRNLTAEAEYWAAEVKGALTAFRLQSGHSKHPKLLDDLAVSSGLMICIHRKIPAVSVVSYYYTCCYLRFQTCSKDSFLTCGLSSFQGSQNASRHDFDVGHFYNSSL